MVKFPVKPIYFDRPAEFRRWLDKNHARASELFVGFYKARSGKRSMIWAEAVRQALCYGWIDSVLKPIDAERYALRFSPRRRGSNWSAVNIRLAKELIATGLMQPAGAKAFAERDEKKINRYSFEQAKVSLGGVYEKKFRALPAAWTFFQSLAPSYRKAATWWVISAKQEATRERRLKTLIADSAQGLRIAPMRRAEN